MPTSVVGARQDLPALGEALGDADLGRHRGRDRGDAALVRLAHGGERLEALLLRRPRPRREGPVGRPDRRLHVGGGGGRHARDLLLRRRIHDDDLAPGVDRIDPFPVDEELACVSHVPSRPSRILLTPSLPARPTQPGPTRPDPQRRRNVTRAPLPTVASGRSLPLAERRPCGPGSTHAAASCQTLPHKVPFPLTRIRRGGYVFVTWAGDHPPRHVHVLRADRLVLKWNLDKDVAMFGTAKPALVALIRQRLREEGRL